MDYISTLPSGISFSFHWTIILKCVELSRNGPICCQMAADYESENLLGILEHKFDYSSVVSLHDDSFLDILYARQIQALFSKNEDLSIPGVDKRQACLDGFLKTERHCMAMNWKFLHGIPFTGFEPILHRAQRIIDSILGECPEFSQLEYAFGPGVNTSTKLDEANARIKLSSSLECSTNLFDRAWEFLAEFPLWDAAHLSLVRVAPGRFGMVAKSWKILRTIITETILNGLGQKGIGTKIRDKLRSAGINLRDQTRNQKLAYYGSRDGTYCTIDIENASNTICYGLVSLLIPPAWFSLLELFRTDEVVMPDKSTHQLQLFSSMGNAYTFELESLIFYALSQAVVDHLQVKGEVSVYGDDIIVPTAAHELLVQVLNEAGFTVNPTKSFAVGPFRESCGADYLFGMDIRPFYQKEKVSVRTLFCMYNWFMRRFEFQLAAEVLNFIPKHVRLFGPDGYGDGHLIGPYELRRSRIIKRAGQEGGFFDSYKLIGKRNKKAYANDWVYPAYSVYVRSGSESETNPNIIRGTRGFEKISIYTLADTIYGVRPNIDVGTLLGQSLL